MRCKNCHYSLEGLTEHRCPECGRGFDPRDQRTFDVQRRWQASDDWRVMAGLYLVSTACVFIAIRNTEDDWSLIIQLVVSAFSAVFWTLFAWALLTSFEKGAHARRRSNQALTSDL